MEVHLTPVDHTNLAACAALHVAPEQTPYIAANAASIQTAQENPEVARPFAIVIDGVIAGFAMFAFDMQNDDPADRHWLWRFMLDQSYQGKGYGGAALKEIIRYFWENGADEITLSTKQTNTHALSLYHKFGFQENGQKNGEEVVLKLHKIVP